MTMSSGGEIGGRAGASMFQRTFRTSSPRVEWTALVTTSKKRTLNESIRIVKTLSTMGQAALGQPLKRLKN